MSDRTPHRDAVHELVPTAPIDGLDVARLDTLRDLDPGDTSYLDRAIANFEANSAEAVTAIRAAVAAGDTATLRARAHKIAGSALNLGCHRAGRAARAVELAADDDRTEVGLALLPELADAMTQARDLLRRYRTTYAS